MGFARLDYDGRASSITRRKIQRNQRRTGCEEEYCASDDPQSPAQNLEDVLKIVLLVPPRRRRQPFYPVLPYRRG